MNSSLHSAHRAAIAVLATVIWEFFSYFGMRALLILYLTQALHFTDTAAFSLYGAYLALVFLTPIIGGWLADKLLGFKTSVIIGCLLIILGHTVLGLTGHIGLYLGLAWLILGVGFFKTNAICMVADCYRQFPSQRDSAYVWYYVAANIGATLGPIVCAVVAKAYGWHWGFGAAGVGMLIGLTILLSQRHYLREVGLGKQSLTWRSKLSLALGCLVMFGFITIVLLKGWSAWVLIGTGLLAIPFVCRIYKEAKPEAKRNLAIILVLTLFGTAFWAFDQQGGSSISLFILRNVTKQIGSFHVPTAWFQSINPATILVSGPIIAIVWRMLARMEINLSAAFKVMIGLLLLTLGFVLFITGATLQGSHTNMAWPVLGLVLIGVAELFVDPIILSEISKSAPSEARGFITGLYYLFVGAYANYASVQIAKLSVVFTQQKGPAVVSGYIHEFSFIAICAAILTLGLFVFGLYGRIKLKKC